MSEIIKKNLSEIIELIKKKEIKSEELAQLYIDEANKSKNLIHLLPLVLRTLLKKQKNLIKNQIQHHCSQAFL